MPTYVTLAHFTDQGMKNIKGTTKRAEAFKKAAKEAGFTVKEILWTQGQYDLVTIVEGSDNTAMSAMSLSVAKMGNITEQTSAPSPLPIWTRFWERLRSEIGTNSPLPC
jgi:uncharacterized protein with GYD domain